MNRPILARPWPPTEPADRCKRRFAARLGWLAILLGTAQIAVAAAPFAATQAPGPISATNATLNGMASPNSLPAVAWFDWGTNAACGQSTSPVEVGEGNSVRRVSAGINGLAPSGIYHYRLVVSNAAGLVLGMERRFTTGLRVRAWGYNSQWQTNVPSGVTNAVAIAAGSGYGVAATSDGKVIGWGSGFYTPTGLSNVIAVATGTGLGLALQADGQVVKWINYYTRSTVGSNVVALAAGPTSYPSYLFLRSDGTVTGAGGPLVPSGLSNLVAVATGTSFSLALKADGAVVTWGSPPAPMPVGLSNVLDIAAGNAHSVALKADGTVVAWGMNYSQQTNVPLGLSNVVAIAAGGYASLALKRDGGLVAWGHESSGFLKPPTGLTNVVTIASGIMFDVVLANRPPQADAREVAVPLNQDSVITLSGTDPDGDPLRYRITALPAVGSLFQYTTNGRGAPIVTAPAELTDSAGRLILAPATGGSTNPLTTLTFLVNDGNADSSPADLTIRTLSQPLAFTQRVTPATATTATFHGMVTPNTWLTTAWFEYGTTIAYGQSTSPAEVGDAAGVAHTSAEVTALVPNEVYHGRLVASNLMGVTYGRDVLFTTGRRIAAWGNNWWGQTDIPASLSNATIVTSGDFHGLALAPSGALMGWGSPTYATAAIPPDLTNAATFAGGGEHSLAVRQDGTALAWGDDTYGQTNLPPGLSNVIAVAGGAFYSLALRADGTVVAWGDNRYGQTNVPVGLSNVVAISARGRHSLALRNNGTVIAWGDNDNGQISVPNRVSNVVAVAAGFWHSLALRADGTVVAWGASGWDYGQIRVPAGLSNVVVIAGGGYHSLALQADGTVVAWGGGFGMGQAIVPTGLKNAVDIAGGFEHSLALAPNVPPQTSNQAVTGITNQPLTITLIASDPNSDPFTLHVLSLPLQGNLFQYATNGPGERITAPFTLVADPLHRVIFVPDLDGIGNPYADFIYVANDGEAESWPATVAVHVLPPPRLEGFGFNAGTGSAFELQFSGLPGAAYRVQASTDFVDWRVIGAASESPPGWFRFSDPQSTNWPRRFYRVGSP
jgi:alpha-tubulin suppressor-like RCC1 family protein